MKFTAAHDPIWKYTLVSFDGKHWRRDEGIPLQEPVDQTGREVEILYSTDQVLDFLFGRKSWILLEEVNPKLSQEYRKKDESILLHATIAGETGTIYPIKNSILR